MTHFWYFLRKYTTLERQISGCKWENMSHLFVPKSQKKVDVSLVVKQVIWSSTFFTNVDKNMNSDSWYWLDHLSIIYGISLALLVWQWRYTCVLCVQLIVLAWSHANMFSAEIRKHRPGVDFMWRQYQSAAEMTYTSSVCGQLKSVIHYSIIRNHCLGAICDKCTNNVFSHFVTYSAR